MIAGVALAVVLIVVWALFAVSRSRRTTTGGVHETLVDFVEQSLELGSVTEILGFAGEAARVVLGAERAVAIVPLDGDWEAHVIGGDLLGKVPPASRGLFGWLKHNPAVISVGELGGARFGAMRQPLRQLLDGIGCDILLPLVDRQDVMAVLAIKQNRAMSVDRAVIELFQEQCTTACANARLHVEASHAFSLAREVSLASAFHESLVAASRVGAQGALRWAGDVEVAGEAGSDFWSMYALGGDRVLMMVGDSVGAGLAGSMTSAVVKSACDLLVTGDKPIEDPAALLTMLSRALAHASAPVHARCFAGIFDARGGVVRYANAGGPIPYLVRGGGTLGALTGGGPMLGDAFDEGYKVHEAPIALGESFVLFTDGLTRAENAQRDQFGERRLQKVLAAQGGRAATHVLAAVQDAVRRHRGSRPLVDDAAIVVVSVAE
ncbi:MAG TPA: PP2C family protein-serine/threonine phosphatase [Kofleriaceae bacterium]|nr:PP2C family protein-serine/threonine phosphatase [Kofleriaceae bacterium]